MRALFLSGQHIIHPPGVTREARYRASNWSDVIDAGDLGHLLETLGVSIDARKEMPDADRAAGPGDRPGIVGADLPAAERRWPHRPRSEHGRVRQQQRLCRDLGRLHCHVLRSVRDVADKAEPITGTDPSAPNSLRP